MAINKEILDLFLKSPEFYDVFWRDKYSKESLETICEYCLAECDKIATKNNIQIPSTNISEMLGVITKHDVDEIVKSTEKIEDINELENIVRFISNNRETLRQYCEPFTRNPREIFDFFKNPDLLSGKELLRARWEQQDIKMPLEQKRIVEPSWATDGWDTGDSALEENNGLPLQEESATVYSVDDFFDQMRLETDQEVQERIALTLQNRQIELENTSDVDNKEAFAKWYYFLNNALEIQDLMGDMGESVFAINERINEIKLQNFKQNTKFYNDLLNIMQHDKNKFIYHYHGTQGLEDAESICKLGLFMANYDLSSTTYSEFTPEELLLYQRGFAGEIGSSAVVIVKQPIVDNKLQEIVEFVPENTRKNANFAQSGMGGFESDGPEFYVPRKYIVGYVDKINQKVIYNEKQQVKTEAETSEEMSLGK